MLQITQQLDLLVKIKVIYRDLWDKSTGFGCLRVDVKFHNQCNLSQLSSSRFLHNKVQQF